MSIKNIPWAHATSLFEIEIGFFQKHDIQTIFVDLDNTLDSHRDAVPTEATLAFKKLLDENKITLIIISNNNEGRVKKYADALGAEYLANSNKPSRKKIKALIEAKQIDLSKAVYVGDQVINDIRFANKLNVRTILVDPLSPSDQFVTKFVRLWDKPLRCRLKKKNHLVDWRKK